MLRLRLYGPGLVPPMVDLVAGDDKIEIVLTEKEKRVVVRWGGTLEQLAMALKQDGEGRRVRALRKEKREDAQDNS